MDHKGNGKCPFCTGGKVTVNTKDGPQQQTCPRCGGSGKGAAVIKK